VSRPLQGLQIFECASFVAGPTGGMTLAQLGADVVRIDPLGGNSDYERWPVAPSGASFYWASLNKGKRSVAVDMRSAQGRELVVALVTAAGADRGILVDNLVGRSWMSNDLLRQRRQDLVHLRVQGYPDGRPSVDYTVNAEVGVPFFTGPDGVEAPVNHVVPAWDLVTGLSVSTAVLAAVLDRRQRGVGAFVEIALADVALAAVANMGWLSEVQSTGVDRPRHGNFVYGSFGIDFACRDGERVMIVALTEGQWDALRKVTGTVDVFHALEIALSADLDREADRYRLRETIAAILRPWFLARTFDEVRRQLDSARVLWGHYQRASDVVKAFRRGEYPLLADVELPDRTPAITARSPMRWNGDSGEPGATAVLGRETGEVLAEVLGLTDAELGRLAGDGVLELAAHA
jgi:2-methylfumaryl-CoA isomerase